MAADVQQNYLCRSNDSNSSQALGVIDFSSLLKKRKKEKKQPQRNPGLCNEDPCTKGAVTSCTS